MVRKVAVTGFGVISPLGDSPSRTHAALCDGRTALRPIEGFETPGMESPLAGEISSFTARDYLERGNLRPLDRTSELLTVAVQLALQSSGLTPERLADQEVGLVVGTMFCSVHTISQFDCRALQEGPARASPMDFANTVINAAAGQAGIWHKLAGVNSTIAAGAASGLQAIAYAADMIRDGLVDAPLVVAGVDELCYESLYGFTRAGWSCNAAPNRSRPIPFDARRNGFCLAEGAGAVVLESADSAAERGATIVGEIAGHASGFDIHSDSGPDAATESSGCFNETIEAALQDADLSAADINAVSASANGSVEGDLREAFALRHTFGGHLDDLPITAIKAMLGESLGAAGALQVIDMLETIRDGRLPGIVGLEQVDSRCSLPTLLPDVSRVTVHNALINSIGFDGNCVSLVVRRHSPRSGANIE